MTTVVIIDDSEGDRYLTQRTLEEGGYTGSVFEYQTADDALPDFSRETEFAKKFGSESEPIVILLDINMPGMTGFEFLEEISGLEAIRNRCVVILMMSSSTSPADKVRASSFTLVKGYLPKPVDDAQLQQFLRQSEECCLRSAQR